MAGGDKEQQTGRNQPRGGQKNGAVTFPLAADTLAALQELFVSRGEPAVADLLFPSDAIDPLM